MKALVGILGMLAFLFLLVGLLSLPVKAMLIGLSIWFLLCLFWFAVVSIAFDINELLRKQDK